MVTLWSGSQWHNIWEVVSDNSTCSDISCQPLDFGMPWNNSAWVIRLAVSHTILGGGMHRVLRNGHHIITNLLLLMTTSWVFNLLLFTPWHPCMCGDSIKLATSSFLYWEHPLWSRWDLWDSTTCYVHQVCIIPLRWFSPYQIHLVLLMTDDSAFLRCGFLSCALWVCIWNGD